MQSLFTYIRKDYITLPFSSILVKKKQREEGRKERGRKERRKKYIEKAVN